MGKIRRFITVTLSLFAVITTLSGCEGTKQTSEKNNRPVIKIGCDQFPPFNYLNEDGVPEGIDMDLATEAFGRMGYDVEINYIEWEKKKDLVESGQIDCIWDCFSMKGRIEDYQWAGPYMVSNQVVAVNESSDIYTLQDLEGKNLAVRQQQPVYKASKMKHKNPREVSG